MAVNVLTLAVEVNGHPHGLGALKFKTLPVTLLTTRFYIKKFCMLITLHLCVLYGCQNK